MQIVNNSKRENNLHFFFENKYLQACSVQPLVEGNLGWNCSWCLAPSLFAHDAFGVIMRSKAANKLGVAATFSLNEENT